MPRLQGHSRPREAGELVPGSSPADGHAGVEPAAKETAAQTDIPGAPSKAPQGGRRQRPTDRKVREHARSEQPQGLEQKARLPWAQPARPAAHATTGRTRENRTPSPADRWGRLCRQPELTRVAWVQQGERLAPGARLPWAPPDRGTASERARRAGVPGATLRAARVTPMRRTAGVTAL